MFGNESKSLKIIFPSSDQIVEIGYFNGDFVFAHTSNETSKTCISPVWTQEL